MTQTPSPEPIATIPLAAEVAGLVAIHGAPLIAAALGNGHVVLWNGGDHAASSVLKPHNVRVLAISSSNGGRDIWTLAADGTLTRTPIAAGQPPQFRHLDLGSPAARAAAFSADAATLVTGGEFGELRIFETQTGVLRRQLRPHRTELQAIAVRSRPSIFASASAEADLRMFDASSGRELSSFDGDLSTFAVAFSPKDGTLASGGADRCVTLRNAKTFRPEGEFKLHKPQIVATLAWSPDGRLMAVGDIDDESLSKGWIHVIDAATLKVMARLDTTGVPASAVVFTSDGRTIVAAVAKELRAWAVPS